RRSHRNAPHPRRKCGLTIVGDRPGQRAAHEEPFPDSEIERGLRERVVSDPRAAEILLRWLQGVRPPEATPGVDLDARSEAQLERLYAGLTRLAALPEDELQALIASLRVGEADARA